jgi:hypothetical protein
MFVWDFSNANLVFQNLQITTTPLHKNMSNLISGFADMVYLKNDSLKLSYFFPEYFTQENLINLEL